MYDLLAWYYYPLHSPLHSPPSGNQTADRPVQHVGQPQLFRTMPGLTLADLHCISSRTSHSQAFNTTGLWSFEILHTVIIDWRLGSGKNLETKLSRKCCYVLYKIVGVYFICINVATLISFVGIFFFFFFPLYFSHRVPYRVSMCAVRCNCNYDPCLSSIWLPTGPTKSQ